jgi:epoxyqueuosine reductase QueG
VGFAHSDDPLITRFKEAVGNHHLSPSELWKQAFPGEVPRSLSIIAWVLPFSQTIRESNRRQCREPSPHWGHARLFAELLNNQVRCQLVTFLNERGWRAVAPGQFPTFEVLWDRPEGPISNWSERHYCLAAGLGTFGLNRGLITLKGQAMRCGTVLTDLNLSATERKFSSYTEYCPYLEVGTCGACIQRCPVGCITSQGKDNAKCFRYLSKDLAHLTTKYLPEEVLRDPRGRVYGGLYFCGLCHTGVPCEAGIPSERRFKTATGPVSLPLSVRSNDSD